MAEWSQSWSGDGSWRCVESSRSNNNPNRWHNPTSRPPIHPGVVEDTVPLWEKKYCTTMLRMPWKMLCLNQNYTGLYKNVMEWDDSGALEAFQNAKLRFCAEYHGDPCSIPLPDPDLYIDKVDDDCFVDPELVADLEKEPPPPPVDGVEFGGVNSVIVRDYCNVVPTGWDEASCDAYVVQPQKVSGWDDAAAPDNSGWSARERNDECGYREADRKVGEDDPWNSAKSGWRDATGPDKSGWRDTDGPDKSSWSPDKSGWRDAAGRDKSGWNAKERNNKWCFRQADRKVVRDDPWNSVAAGWSDAALPGDSWSSGQVNQNEFGRNPQPWNNNKNWESTRRYGRKRDGGGGRSNGRYTKPKFNLGVYQPNNDWRNCVARNSSDSRYEKKVYPKQPLAW